MLKLENNDSSLEPLESVSHWLLPQKEMIIQATCQFEEKNRQLQLKLQIEYSGCNSEGQTK